MNSTLKRMNCMLEVISFTPNQKGTPNPPMNCQPSIIGTISTNDAALGHQLIITQIWGFYAGNELVQLPSSTFSKDMPRSNKSRIVTVADYECCWNIKGLEAKQYKNAAIAPCFLIRDCRHSPVDADSCNVLLPGRFPLAFNIWIHHLPSITFFCEISQKQAETTS